MLPFGGGNQFLSQRSSAEGLADGADAHILSKKAGLRVGYVVGERVDGAPGLFRQASGGRWWGHNAMCMHGSRCEFASRAKINAETLRCLVTNH